MNVSLRILLNIDVSQVLTHQYLKELICVVSGPWVDPSVQMVHNAGENKVQWQSGNMKSQLSSVTLASTGETSYASGNAYG